MIKYANFTTQLHNVDLDVSAEVEDNEVDNYEVKISGTDIDITDLLAQTVFEKLDIECINDVSPETAQLTKADDKWKEK